MDDPGQMGRADTEAREYNREIRDNVKMAVAQLSIRPTGFHPASESFAPVYAL